MNLTASLKDFGEGKRPVKTNRVQILWISLHETVAVKINRETIEHLFC